MFSVNHVVCNAPLGSKQDAIVKFSNLLDGKKVDGISKGIRKQFRQYMELSEKQTTDASKREQREKLLCNILEEI